MITSKVLYLFLSALMLLSAQQANGYLSAKTRKMIAKANRDGPYLGLVIPNLFEMNPLLQSPNFTSSNLIIDFAGRRFRFGKIAKNEVILVMTGLGMINAGITTQLLLSFFKIEGVVHYGIAGNANPSLNIGDVAIPQYWGHTALWSWQRYGQGPEDELPLESNGDYIREIGYLKFANYTTNVTDGSSYDNLLNNIWYQPEEVFPINGTPKQREHAFWVSVDPLYFEISKKLELDGVACFRSNSCTSPLPLCAPWL
ncbi:hypothetical protein ACJW31_10G101000 [Castanea mollissima]